MNTAPTLISPTTALGQLSLSVIAYHQVHRDQRMSEVIRLLLSDVTDALQSRNESVIRGVLAVSIDYIGEARQYTADAAVALRLVEGRQTLGIRGEENHTV